jgi:folate-dependent phosphoribosylglycinamide formyltransferase PurN
MSQLKIVFIAFNENSLGRRIISGLVRAKNPPILTLMASPEVLKKFRKNGVRRYFNNNGLFNTIWRIYYRLTVRRDIRTESILQDSSLNISIKDICKKEEIPIIFFDKLYDKHIIEKIRRVEPDLIVLGGAPIIKKEIIEIPKIAVLNSHPGILPFAKGIDVVSQSILNNIPVGATVFKVDEGVDSGPIILIKQFKTSYYGMKLHEIEAKVEEISALAMLEAIQLISEGDYEFVPQTEKGTMFKSLDFNKYVKVKAILKNHN